MCLVRTALDQSTRRTACSASLFNHQFLTSLSPLFDQRCPSVHYLQCETGYMAYCLDITYVLCYLARMMSDATESHTTRSWSMRLSDSSASCTQFWITAQISRPATFDLRCPAHNYRRLLDDCHLVPGSSRMLLLFHLDPRKSVLTASSHLLLIKTYAFCVAGRSPKCSPSWLLASFRHLIRAISSTLHTVRQHSYSFPSLGYSLSPQRER